MFDLIIKLIEHKGEIIQALSQIAAGVVTLCAVGSAFLPPANAPGPYADLRKLVNLAGQNYRYAKNAVDKKPPAPFI